MNSRTGDIKTFASLKEATEAGYDKRLSETELKMLDASTPDDRVRWAKAQPRQSAQHAEPRYPTRRFKTRVKQSRI